MRNGGLIGVPPVEKKCYKPLEAARILGISKETLLALEREGRIPSVDRDDHGNRVYTPEQIEIVRDVVGGRPVVNQAPRVVAVFNMKGGVGKSTISANLAVKTAEKGLRVLALDADPQGHLTTSLGQEPADFPITLLQMLIPDRQGEAVPVTEARKEITPNLHLVPANLSMCAMNLLLFQQPEREYRLRRAIEAIRATAAYDLVIVDSPPSYDITSLNILLSTDLVLAPVKLDGNSFYGLEYLFDTIRDVKRVYRYTIPTVMIVPNHYNGSYSVSRQILEGLRTNYSAYLAKTVVRQDVNFDKANALRQSIFSIAPSCKGSKDMESLALEIMEMVARNDSLRNAKA
jgi:chromosome partitioning protein